LPLLMASVSAVVVSTLPLPSTRAITRLTADEVDVVTLAASAASYPAAVKYFPSEERVNSPSEVAVPLPVNLLFDPIVTVGIAID
jgi:hypothetical protein